MDMTLPFPGAFEAARDDAEGDALRPLDWSALLARLAAERDLRRELASGLAASKRVADFRRGAALVVSAVASHSSHDAPSVNPNALAVCKSTGGNTFAIGQTMTVARLGARGQQ